MPDQAAVLVPGSSIELPEDAGRAAHTNHVILFRSAPQATAPSGMSPANIYSAYNFTAGGAMAPYAKIVRVEAASNSLSDLLKAVDMANGIAAASSGRGQVSMSWGASEFSSEASYDSHFTKTGVVYFGASGDSGGKTIWPGVSPF